jgi:hypothetical protein
MHELGYAAAPGAWLVDLIPSRKLWFMLFDVNSNPTLLLVRHIPSWFPGAEFKRTAKVWRAKLERFINEPHEWAKSQMVRLTLC